jgi:RNA polymerase sigma factor (sigma-70 family)
MKSPSQDASVRESCARLERALAVLTPDQMSVVRHAYFSGRSYREIGQIMGLTETAVQMRIQRALTILRTAYLRS